MNDNVNIHILIYLLCCAASPWNPVGGRVRTVAGVWLLLALVLSTVFRANLKAMLILPRLQLPFDSLETLIQSRIPTYIPKATVFHKIVMVNMTDVFIHWKLL